MRRLGPRPYLPIAIGTGLFAALALLALLQYRWIAKVSEAERERLQASLESASSRFCDSLDRELTRASRHFQVEDGLPEADLENDINARLKRWRSTAPDPRLVEKVLVVTRLGRDEVELRRLDETTGRLVPASWGRETASLDRIFHARARIPRLDENLPGIILPVRSPAPPRNGEPPEPAERRPPRHHVIVRLNRTYLAKEFLPRAAEREFGGNGHLAYAVTVAVGEFPGSIIYEGGPPMAPGAARGTADVLQRFFALRPFPDLANPPAERRPPRREPGDPAPPREDGAAAAGPEAGRWQLEIRHPAGSLEAAISSARRVNLGISLAVLVLVATTSVLLVVSTRRSDALARQQMDFVASVSHELKTPLTAMRSAGQNLADGIISDPEKVRRYGALIEKEGRRLTEMVGRVLTFAGIQAGSQTFQRHPVSVKALIEGVLADTHWVLEEKHIRVETDLADKLPPVPGDEPALRQALGNLLDNALKYGGQARWIGVQARLEAGHHAEEVVITVSDHGIGIRRADLPRLFEPFFRSSEALATGAGGSGLGLAVVRGIVEAHGGRVTAESQPGKGSTFAIHLPAMAGNERNGTAT